MNKEGGSALCYSSLPENEPLTWLREQALNFVRLTVTVVRDYDSDCYYSPLIAFFEGY